MALVRLGPLSRSTRSTRCSNEDVRGSTRFRPRACTAAGRGAGRFRAGRRARDDADVQALLQNQRTLELMQTMAMTLAEMGRFEDAVRFAREKQ